MHIGEREIGPDQPVYVIAEIGVNHDGQVERALGLIDAASSAGADAVKLQYFETDALLSRAARLAAYQEAAGETDPVEMLHRLELTLEDMALVVEHAHERGIHAIATVFSIEHVPMVSKLRWDAFKTASPDVINRPLLDTLAADGRPMIVSTGASTLDEVVRAAGWLESSSVIHRLALLQCVSSYPAPEPALGGIGAVRNATGLTVGYSDHTEHVSTGAEAVRAGACLLERHLTYDTSAAGPDHAASLEPDRFERYVNGARNAEPGGAVVGSKSVLDCERDVRTVSRQSLTATRALRTGETIERSNLTIKRPGMGIEPWRMHEIIGRRVVRAVEADVPLVDDDLGVT